MIWGPLPVLVWYVLLPLGPLIGFMAVRHRRPGVPPAGIQLWRPSSYTDKGREWYYAMLVWTALIVIF